ncbi:hypothetical protein D3C85_1493410 [compost metagenome]
MHLRDNHLLRPVDLGQRHFLAIPVILSAGQRPVFRLRPLAAGPAGAFARSAFGGGKQLDRTIAEHCHVARVLSYRFAAGEFDRNGVDRRFGHRNGDGEVADIYAHGGNS